MQTELHTILSLIAATIFADKRVHASEIETFIKATSKLRIIKKLDPKMTQARLLDWFEANKDDIRDNITTPYFKDWLYKILDRLAETPDKDAILNVMHRISIADDQIHVSERALITLTARHWGLLSGRR